MNQILKFSLIFLLSYTFFLLILPQPQKISENQIIIKGKQEYTFGEMVSFDVFNNTKEKVEFKDYCPNSPLKVEFLKLGEKKDLTNVFQINDCKAISLASGERKVISFGDENLKMFGEIGDYKIIFETKDGKIYENNVKIVESGFFGKIWDGLFYKPLYNFLIWLIEVGPGNSLAFAIIVLTILIKLALLYPNHKALKSQKELQKIQPKLDEIKKKYAGDQAKIAQETMQIWKKNGVNPMGSCLPILIQFPFLIAIFYIIKDGLTANNAYLLYGFLQDFDYGMINSHFFGLFDLKDSYVWYLAIIIGLTQYWQMHLTFAGQKTQPVGLGGIMEEQMKIMGKTMKYVMPLMITVFSYTMPAGLGIYWFVSTLFSAVQQLYVNYKSDNDDNPKKPGKKNKKNKNISDAVIVKKHEKKDGVTVIEA
ncbi:YidC/Oxa1 family membrane protein insertase [Candidatus Gracilibacteria bacterium]|nr:YidC/Oxa1 family membrane protein insertase [Candidatus Gracilibacteria bacterium]